MKIKTEMEESHSIFVLKFMENEEYLYGDYLIGAYNSVRVFLRQHETINFYLKIIPLFFSILNYIFITLLLMISLFHMEK